MNELDKKYWPVDRVVIAYNLALAILWVFGLSSAPYAPALVIGHLALAAVPIILGRLNLRKGGWVTRARELYPIVLVGVYWSEVGLIRTTFHSGSYDDLVLGVEESIFGTIVHQSWIPSMPYVWLAEIMQVLYLLYYPIVFLTPVLIAFRGRHDAAKDVAFHILLVYLVCFVSFAVFPIDGPRYLMTPFEGDYQNGFFHRFAESLHSGGDQAGGAFPSTHVAGVTVMALLAWRWFTRPVAILFWIGALGVTVSAVYLQNHYAMDSIVGMLVGLISFSVIGPLLVRLFDQAHLWVVRMRGDVGGDG